MFENEKIVNIMPVKNMKVKLRYRNYCNEKGESEPFEEVKDVICLALTEETEPKYKNTQSIHPMIFDEYVDFAESEQTEIIDLYYDRG